MQTKSIPIIPSLGVDVVMWGIDGDRVELKKDEGDKVKNFDIHAKKPWILSVDRDDDIYVWDFSTNALLFNKSLSELLSDSDISITDLQLDDDALLNNKNKRNTVDQHFMHQLLKNNSPTINGHQSTSLFSYYNSTLYEETILIGKDMPEKTNSESNSKASVAETEKTVKHVAFIDQSCIQNNPCESSTPCVSSFNSTSRIMIICKEAVIFHDFLTDVTNTITASELNNKTPTTAEFVFYNICAIGCSDGVIRVWDCSKWIEIKQLTAHPKCEILVVKSLPVLFKRGESDSVGGGTSNSYERHTNTVVCDQAGSAIREGRVRLLTIGSDGVSFIWEGAVIGNIVQLSSTVPTCQLEGIGPTNSTVCHSVFVDEDSNSLFTLSADHIIRIWDLDQIPSEEAALASQVQSKSHVRFRSSTFSKLRLLSNAKGNVRRRSSGTNQGGFGSLGTPSKDALGTKMLKSIERIKFAPNPNINFQKLIWFKALYHPMFTTGTFMATSKSSNIVITRLDDDKSNSASVSDSGMSKTSGADNMFGTLGSRQNRDKDRIISLAEPLQVLNINTLLACYINNLKHPFPIQLIAAASDPAVKIYKVQPHSVYQNIVAVATSVGLVVLNIAPKQMIGPYTGTHPLWGKVLLSFNGATNTLVKSSTKAPLSNNMCDHSDDEDEISPSSISCRVPIDQVQQTTMTQPIAQGSPNNVIIAQRTASSQSIGSVINSSTIELEPVRVLTNEVLSIGSKRDTGRPTVGMISRANSSRRLFGTKATNLTTDESIDAATPSTRPIFQVSPGGQFCAIIWPATACYIIVRTNFDETNFSTISNKPNDSPIVTPTKCANSNYLYSDKMEIIERGSCISFAWLLEENYAQPKSEPNENMSPLTKAVYAILLPGTRKITVVKAKRVFGVLRKAEEEEEAGAFVPPSLAFKELNVSAAHRSSCVSTQTHNIDVNTSSIYQPSCLYSGPNLLCITSIRNQVRQKGYMYSNTNSVFAADISPNTAIKTTAKLSTSTLNNIQVLSQITKTYLEESVGNAAMMLDYQLKSQFFVLQLSQNASSYELIPVGPVLGCVTAVSWDYNSNHCAVVIGTRVNILRVVPLDPTTAIKHNSENKYQFASIASIDWSLDPLDAPTSLFWRLGILYLTTANLVCVAATHHPFLYWTKPSAKSTTKSITSASSNLGMKGKAGKRQVTTTAVVAQVEESRVESLVPELQSSNIDAFLLATQSQMLVCPSRMYSDCSSYASRPIGWLEVVGIEGGNVVYNTREVDYVARSTALSSNPLAAIAIQLSHSNGTKSSIRTCPFVQLALEWAKETPYYLHDRIAAMFARRGLLDEAKLLAGCSPILKIDMSIRQKESGREDC